MTETAASHGIVSRSAVLHVCTSCRTRGAPREPRENRPGFQLYRELRAAFHESPLGQRVEVRPAECLSLCPRPCGIALTSPGAWSYLFGDQQPETAGDILECVSLYIDTEDVRMDSLGAAPGKMRTSEPRTRFDTTTGVSRRTR